MSAGSRMIEAPTRVRYWVIVFAVALAVVTYIDRVSFGNAEMSSFSRLCKTPFSRSACRARPAALSLALHSRN